MECQTQLAFPISCVPSSFPHAFSPSPVLETFASTCSQAFLSAVLYSCRSSLYLVKFKVLVALYISSLLHPTDHCTLQHRASCRYHLIRRSILCNARIRPLTLQNFGAPCCYISGADSAVFSAPLEDFPFDKWRFISRSISVLDLHCVCVRERECNCCCFNVCNFCICFYCVVKTLEDAS